MLFELQVVLNVTNVNGGQVEDINLRAESHLEHAIVFAANRVSRKALISRSFAVLHKIWRKKMNFHFKFRKIAPSLHTYAGLAWLIINANLAKLEHCTTSQVKKKSPKSSQPENISENH